jgi:hypothetical protein
MTAAEAILDLAAVVAGVRAAIAEGARVELGGLEAEIGDAMAAAAAAPLCEHGALRTALHHLCGELDRLAAALARRRDAEAQQRARSAYGGAATAGPPPGSDQRS